MGLKKIDARTCKLYSRPDLVVVVVKESDQHTLDFGIVNMHGKHKKALVDLATVRVNLGYLENPRCSGTRRCKGHVLGSLGRRFAPQTAWLTPAEATKILWQHLSQLRTLSRYCEHDHDHVQARLRVVKYFQIRAFWG